jgi:type II secretory pathway component PulL
MAMTKCKECGHSVSTQAKSCPNCGAQLKGKVAGRVEAGVKWGIAGVVAVVALAFVVSYWRNLNAPADSQLLRDVEELQRQRQEQGQ